MKKTKIYICKRTATHYNIENGEFLTEFEGLYDIPSFSYEIRVNGVLYLLKEFMDDFTKEGVTRYLFLVKF